MQAADGCILSVCNVINSSCTNNIIVHRAQ